MRDIAKVIKLDGRYGSFESHVHCQRKITMQAVPCPLVSKRSAGPGWHLRVLRFLIVGVVLFAVERAAASDPLPSGNGATRPFYPCFSTDDCAPQSACVDNGGDGSYYCKPSCTADADCKKWPYPSLKCLPVVDAAGKQYSPQVCNDRQSTLATIISDHTSLSDGAIAWYEVHLRAPEAQHMRIQLGLRTAEIERDIRARLVSPVQEVVERKFGTVDWANFRFSNFRATVDSVTFGPGSASTNANVVISGTVNAAREQYVWHWEGIHSGMRWEDRGDKDVATYRAVISITAGINGAGELATQSIVFDPIPTGNSFTVNIVPLQGATFNNAFTVSKPSQQSFNLSGAAGQAPESLKHSRARYVHFVSVGANETVLEADIF